MVRIDLFVLTHLYWLIRIDLFILILSLKGDVDNLELWFGKDDVTISEVGSQKRQAANIFRHINHRYPA